MPPEVFMKRKVTAMGNSQGVLIPKEYLECLGLKKGSEVAYLRATQ